MNYSKLLEDYLSIWNNRSDSEHTLSPKEKLHELIIMELHDEQTHPRTRKTKEMKFYLAIKRVANSSLTDSEKIALIRYYTEVMEEISH
ncbi:hypothetical protein [Heyndrickxia sporothermodurans]|uniref:Uncharacterized protein n=2 Tax=Heyndrickxia sporothermodurans TaxID=46224 RepID=A0A150L968_9BACI|nr:hypothetical protein [Heyndrickxia sporothermodurans]KYD08536.1 hypothetical protein B4102_2813 [Heyndrickxia sporothermodurans]MBL5769346.1 hypothetical protein [Heyndrickxia sporothermodurans]MBL5773126.1 hypothetical protein [Heyndrickxia sporothermodurans]MBL5776616.1 hypothetical protein [Heyndrickxia sporothermodurans]MBL5780121.1 hypothetical protein [Heyndrickxia sporothermodurans]